MKIISFFCFACILSILTPMSLYSQTDSDKYWINEDFSKILPDPGTPTSSTVMITFSGNTVNVVNPYEGKGIEISVTNQNVVVNSSLADTEIQYILSGTTSNGSFKLYGNYKFELVLNGVSIHNPTGAAINIQASKKASVILADYTTNTLTDGTTYTSGTEDMKGTFFSEGQLVFDGKGTLNVNGNYKHAICSDDYIQINNGTITVNNAVSDGIHVNNYFQMDGGNLAIKSIKDGVDCEKGYITVNGGSIQITSSGESGKGLKSAGDMTLAGGDIKMNINGNAAYDATAVDISSPSGVKCDANLIISGNCALNITATGSAGKGISVDGTLVINAGTISITTSGAIYKYGKLDSSPKGIKCEGNLTVNGGTISVKTSKDGGEGMESKNTLTINDGKIEIESYDDGLNAAKNITINGGQIYCYSSGNDGIDSNGTLTITGGVIVSSGTNAPEEGFDCDQNTFKITGGILLGTGGATSTPTSSVCTQRSLVYNTKSLTSGQLVRIEASGKEAITFKMPRTYSNNITILVSSPNLSANTAFTIYTGGSVTGGTEFHGLYTGSTYTKGTQATTFTTSSMVTTVGTSSGGGPGPR